MEEQAAVSVNRVPIRLTEERWRHIIERHAVMVDRQAQVLGSIETPDAVHEGRANTLVAVKREDDLYLVVVYLEISESDGFVVTSYLTRRPGRRKVIWKRY